MGKDFKGCPPGFIPRDLLFNVFLNDISFFINQGVIYNYADDNALSFIHANTDVLKEVLDKVPTLYWLPKLHKKPYKAIFIANSSSCTTTELSKLFTSCLTAVKKHVIKYCEKVYERSGKNLFWSIKNSGEILDKLKARDFNATSLSTYDFSTLYTTLPHNLIKDKLIDLIERTFQREGSPYLACSDRNAFFTSEKPKKISCMVVSKCM